MPDAREEQTQQCVDVGVGAVAGRRLADRTTKLWTASRKLNTLIEPVLLEERYSSPLYDDVLRTGIAV
ncbi:MAG: hypothetical protein IKQ20_07925 [Bacteroidales bacterium]|nr:hypothetical protein [Bacteroidales bacterium]